MRRLRRQAQTKQTEGCAFASFHGEYCVSVAAPCAASESCAFPLLTSACTVGISHDWGAENRREPDRMGIGGGRIWVQPVPTSLFFTGFLEVV